jgi:hypothetical protein
MYTEGTLRRYANAITDPQKKEKFDKCVDSIEFQDISGARTCVSMAAKQALIDDDMSPLFADLNSRLTEFISDEDFANQAERVARWQMPAKIYGVNGRQGIPSLSIDEFPDIKDGAIICEGVVQFTIVGGIQGAHCDTEYLVTDDGTIYADNMLFRGLVGKRARLIKWGENIEIEQA